MPEEHEMPTKVDLPNISLTMPILPNIKLSNNGIEDNEFKFNQPLTIEQFSLQIAEKTCRKKQKTNIKKTQITNTGLNSNDHSNSLAQNSSYNVSTFDTFKNETEKDSMLKNKILETNDKVLDTCKLDQNSKDTSTKKSIDSSDSILESKNKVNDSSQLSVSNENNSSLPQKLTVAHKKWTCDTCWVSNDSEKVSCIACQTPKPGCSQIPLKVSKSSTWTCENCWVPNKNEIDACVACQSQKPGTTKKVIEESSTWTCDACWVKNKNECISCISCGTAKPGCVIENKPQISTQFKFGLNNNSEKFGESGGTQFKFGFDGGKIGQTSSQFKFGSTAFKSSENGKFESSVPEFKFGVNNIKTDQSLGTFKFGTDSVIGQSNKALNYEKNTTTDQPNDSKFKFSFENKSDQPENQFEFSNTSTSKPIAQFKFGLNNMESDKSVQQSLTSDSKDAQSTNELKCVVNNKNEFKEIQNKSIPFRFGDPKKVENSTPQVTLESNEINCNSNALVDIGHKNEVKTNLLWDKKDKIESKPLNFGIPQTLQSTVENSSTTQMVNGHSHSNETSNEDQKPSLIKTSQLFSFSSLGKQDQHLFDGQKNPATFTFGSATTDNKSFIAPISTTSSFSSTAPVFGASNSIFSSGPSTSIPATLGSSVAAPQFSFGSIAPSSSNSFFSKPVKDNDNKLLASNSFTATTNLGFSFGSQSTPVFNVPNSGGLVKSSVLVIKL
jgi:nuclear pore complex protein Nup153